MKLKLKIFSICFLVSALMGILFFFFGFMLLPNEKFEPDLKPVFTTIFFTNLEIHGFALLFSILSFGLFSIVFLFEQFFYLGYIFHSLMELTSFKTAYSFFAGHGVLEVINMFFTATIGIYTWTLIVKMIKRKEFKKHSFIRLGRELFILFIIDIVLIFITALLETFLSPMLVDKSNISHLYLK